jgi:hypothetical protein
LQPAHNHLFARNHCRPRGHLVWHSRERSRVSAADIFGEGRTHVSQDKLSVQRRHVVKHCESREQPESEKSVSEM